LSYEDVKRPDVLYGYPNGIVSYPIPVVSNPAWFAEGTAQFQRAGMTYDTWDSHRDMLLRTRVLAGQELSLTDMGGFYSHNSLERETVYNQGFAFSRYIAAKYGEESLADVSNELASWTNVTFEQAARDAIGTDGREIYDEWIRTIRTDYSRSVEVIREAEVAGGLLEQDGFLNLYPRYSPDGSRLAYLSNKGSDYSRLSLHVVDVDEPAAAAVHIDDVQWHSLPGYTCAFGHQVRSAVTGSFSWRPDGKAIAYSRRTDRRDGSWLNDLYEYDLAAELERRLTEGLRATSPVYAPNALHMVYVSQSDGTSNLWVRSSETGESKPLTSYSDGSQVSDPAFAPDGQSVYFTLSRGSRRGIYRVDLSGGETESVLDTEHDERNPAVDHTGKYLYYASDATGIFNIYRARTDGQDIEQITNVIGGAFMPDPGADGSIAFARYEWDGYKIAVLAEAETATRIPGVSYRPPAVLREPSPDPTFEATAAKLGDYNDADLKPLTSSQLRSAIEAGDPPGVDSGSAGFGLGTVKPYKSRFTSFSFFPVVRLDQYVTRRRSPTEVRLEERSAFETLMRNSKVGFYMTSREILDGLSFLAGFLVGPFSGSAESFGDYIAPSSLLKLERDIFVQFEYAKGFGSARWSPQFILELYNIRRNVENALAIDEFACTACFPPDTTLADVSYNLWELNFAARSKVTRSLVLEAGVRINPYRATTESFYSLELKQTIPATSTQYYVGRAARLKAYYEALVPYRDSDIVPVGIRAEAEYEFEPGRLLDRFTVEDGILTPKYEEFRNHRLTLDVRYGLKLPFRLRRATHGVGVRVRGSTILGDPVDSFFNDYVGGLIGARGYPFYALGGNSTFWIQGSYFFPILPSIRRQVLFIYFDKIYGRVYADAAAAWSGEFEGIGGMRKDVGAEIRMALGSFYLLPTAVFLSATYGLDSFAFELDEGFVTPDGSGSVLYGKTLQWHFGVLFGFDL
jgi:Tol biopolymer transport system component